MGKQSLIVIFSEEIIMMIIIMTIFAITFEWKQFSEQKNENRHVSIDGCHDDGNRLLGAGSPAERP